jgi:hypothetical protein
MHAEISLQKYSCRCLCLCLYFRCRFSSRGMFYVSQDEFTICWYRYIYTYFVDMDFIDQFPFMGYSNNVVEQHHNVYVCRYKTNPWHAKEKKSPTNVSRLLWSIFCCTSTQVPISTNAHKLWSTGTLDLDWMIPK